MPRSAHYDTAHEDRAHQDNRERTDRRARTAGAPRGTRLRRMEPARAETGGPHRPSRRIGARATGAAPVRPTLPRPPQRARGPPRWRHEP